MASSSGMHSERARPPLSPLILPPKNLSEGMKALSAVVYGVNEFGGHAQQQLMEMFNDEDTAISPFAIAIGLLSVHLAATGKTRKEVLSVEGGILAGLDDETLVKAFEALFYEIDTLQEMASFGIGASLWVQDGVEIRPEYREAVSEQLRVGLGSIEGDVEANKSRLRAQRIRAMLEDWFTEVARASVPQASERECCIGEEKYFIATCASFGGEWQSPFDPMLSKRATFTGTDGRRHKVQMMRAKGTFRCYATDQYRAVELPLANGRLSALFVLPEPAHAHHEGVAHLLAWREVNRVAVSLEPTTASVTIPKFTLSWMRDLSEPLMSMGMKSAFYSGADFSNGFGGWSETGSDAFDTPCTEKERPSISLAAFFHACFISVDEYGVNSSSLEPYKRSSPSNRHHLANESDQEAATTTSASQHAGADSSPFSFVADRPFLFYLLDKSTDGILFRGRAGNPAEWIRAVKAGGKEGVGPCVCCFAAG